MWEKNPSMPKSHGKLNSNASTFHEGQLEQTNFTLLPCSLFLPVYYQIHMVHVQIQQNKFGRNKEKSTETASNI